MSMNPAIELRTCQVCKRTLPLDRFYASGTGSGRRHTCSRCLNEKLTRERRASGAKIRHNRYNARGHVYCNHCEKYLPPETFKRHPSRPHTFWSYCKPCTRLKDRERYQKATSTIEGATRVLDSRLARKRRQRAAEQRERREYVVYAIHQLRQRGFTRAEVARLTGTVITTINTWADKWSEKHLLKAVELRLEVVLNAAMDLPIIGYQDRRRLPHPDYARLHALTHDDVQAIYLRNKWTKKECGK